MQLLILMLWTNTAWAQPAKSDQIVSDQLDYKKQFANLITESELSAQLHFLASDFFAGRGVGTTGELSAAHYIASLYAGMQIPPIKNNDPKNPLQNYMQPFEFFTDSGMQKSQNVLAFLEGSDTELKKQLIILVAHYDHLGVNPDLQGDMIYNGAADDGSGTIALLEMAESFNEAKKQGAGPKTSMLFLHTGGEEPGLLGSSHYAHVSPAFPLDQTVAVINLDGIGGVDIQNIDDPDYVYILYNDSTSAHLAEKTRQINDTEYNLKLLTPSNPLSFNSDNKPFEYQLVPSIFFSTGLTEHYHKPTDEAHTIDYAQMAKNAKLIFSLAWDLSNGADTDHDLPRTSFSKYDSMYFCRPCGCSMDHHNFDKPGKCPDCKMLLQFKPVWKRKSKIR